LLTGDDPASEELIEDIVLGSEVDDASVNFVSMVEDGNTAE
jgi:hypothetical protein